MCGNEHSALHTVRLRYASMMTHMQQCVRIVVTKTGAECWLKNVDVGIGELPTGNQVEKIWGHLHDHTPMNTPHEMACLLDSCQNVGKVSVINKAFMGLIKKTSRRPGRRARARADGTYITPDGKKMTVLGWARLANFASLGL